MPRDGGKWDRRIARARDLAETYPFARQILLLYAQLTSLQKSTYLQFPSRCISGSSLPAALNDIDLGYLLARWRPFLGMLEGYAPGPLAEFARGLQARDAATAAMLLRAAWPAPSLRSREALDSEMPSCPPHPLLHSSAASRGATVDSQNREGVGEKWPDGPRPPMGDGRGPVPAGEGVSSILNNQAEREVRFERFCADALLQPYAEFLADHADVPAPRVRPATCPYCGSPPLVGVLRPEGEGGKRLLICSFCRTEWEYLRIACPACDERGEEKLCVYTTSKFEGVRVEACETCKAFLKTVDLTHSGLAVPEVDDLATLPLTLWADENGYHRTTRDILFV